MNEYILFNIQGTTNVKIQPTDTEVMMRHDVTNNAEFKQCFWRRQPHINFILKVWTHAKPERRAHVFIRGTGWGGGGVWERVD